MKQIINLTIALFCLIGMVPHAKANVIKSDPASRSRELKALIDHERQSLPQSETTQLQVASHAVINGTIVHFSDVHLDVVESIHVGDSEDLFLFDRTRFPDVFFKVLFRVIISPNAP